MNEQVTRQILWNIPAPFIVLMYGLLAALMVGCVYAFLKWYRLVTLGVSENRLDHPFERLMLSLRDSFGQGIVIRETWGWMHYSFYVAFVGLFIGTTIVLINSDLRDLFDLFGLDFYFYYGDFYLYFKAAMDTFFLLLILGVLMEGARRAFRKPTAAERSSRRKDARQSREPARLRVPDDDDGAGRRHRPDARGRAHQRRASRVHRMGIRGTRRGTNRGRARRRRHLPSMALAGARHAACSGCCSVFRSPSCAI